jgi:hypothetical protein
LLKRARTFGLYRRVRSLTGKKRARKTALRPSIEMIFCISVCDESTCSGDTSMRKEGFSFWVKTVSGRHAIVRIAKVQPATYNEVAWGKTASVEFEWMWR